jgi:hypothetical protein
MEEHYNIGFYTLSEKFRKAGKIFRKKALSGQRFIIPSNPTKEAQR